MWLAKDFLVTFRMYQMNFDGNAERVYSVYWDTGPSPKKRTCKKCGIIRSHKEAARWEERVSTAEKKKSQL